MSDKGAPPVREEPRSARTQDTGREAERKKEGDRGADKQPLRTDSETVRFFGVRRREEKGKSKSKDASRSAMTSTRSREQEEALEAMTRSK